jgi:catechol 2,3-dioxygenase-like lactoylglutathione lyase family enzyme
MALTSTKFHMSLNVSNLSRAVGFYRVLFGIEPAKRHDDYAKFELAEPPVVFSLVPQPSLAGGSLSKIALRLGDPGAVAEVKARLDAAGITTQLPPGTSCCASESSKFYVADPDLNYWEISAGEDLGSPAPEPPRPAVAPVTKQEPTGPVVWEHFITSPLPDRIPHADDSVDEVRLTGTFNANVEEGRRAGLLDDVRRVLRPGGKLLVHGLVGDRAFQQQPQLPGLAAMVQRVPVQTEPVEALKATGFVAIQFVKFSEKAWFRIDGVELREVKLIAFKPVTTAAPARQVVYRGPFAQAVDDLGNVYPRGQRVSVGAAAAEVLETGAAGSQFLVLPAAGAPAACCGSER